MRNNVFKEHLKWFVVFVALQLLFVDKLLGLLNSFLIIPVFLTPLIWLPINMNIYAVLIYSFFIGFTIDFFTFTVGLHSSTVTIVGFSRIYILNLVASKDKNSKLSPSIQLLGIPLFTIYSSFIYSIFFIVLTILEFSHFSSLIYNIGHIIINVLINVIILLGMEIIKK